MKSDAIKDELLIESLSVVHFTVLSSSNSCWI